MPPDSRREQLIAEALRGRLLEVRASLGTVPTAAERAPAAQDPEEQLRIVMVRLWPPARGEGADAIAFERLVEGILPIEQAADSDLRFLDAWNNAYETLDVHPDWRLLPAARRFLSRYADILQSHVERAI
jgi:hypothetical protein